MNAQTWQRVRELFDALVDTPIAQRAIRLEDLLAEDLATTTSIDQDAIRSEVFAMLAADAQDVLKTNMDALAPELLSSLSEADSNAQQVLAGLRLGAFCLVRELGRGGMGTVWLANRVDGEFEQQVAIKLIQPGWHAAETNARFRAERQILAGLTHPNIAHLIDGGMTADGRPWLALEYVDGLDLSQYCDQNRLTIAQRLQLFLTVCDAVSYAHARLIVHRDLKPSNLLVTAKGVVKLLDFGIAKLIAPDAKISQTRIFTPEYASPEQVRGEAITTSVDVYALGLLLYGLITGQRPYKLQNSTPAAYERAILDQEPTRPSLSVSQQVGGDDIDRRTAQRLKRALRGDLDEIVLKALRKQPEQRFASVSEFAADIENYLARRPVVAGRGGWRYRSARFLRRHALATGLIGLAMLSLSTGLALASWQANEARIQRDVARAEAAKSAQTTEFLLDIFRSADPAATQGEKITAEALLKSGAQRAEQFRFNDPAVQVDLLLAMGEAYLGIGAAKEAFALFKRALDVQSARLPAATEKRVRALTLLARTQGNLDDLKGAEKNLDAAALLLAKLAGESELAADYHMTRGINQMSQGDITRAIDEMSRGTALFSKLRGTADDTTASSAITLSWAFDDQDRHAEARTVLEPIVAALRKSEASNPVRLADALDALANTYTSSADAAAASQMRKDALDITRRVYGATHGYVGIRLNNLAFSLMRSHDYLGANAAMKEAIALRQALEPPGSRKLGSSLNNLASTEYALGQWAQAEHLWSQALDIRRNSTDTTDIAFSLSGLAGAQREQGNVDAAQRHITEALALLRAHPSPKPTHLARILIEQVEVNLAQNIVACAEAEEAVTLMQANASSDDPQRLYANAVAAGCAWRAAQTPENRARSAEAQAAMQAEFPANAERLIQARRYAVSK